MTVVIGSIEFVARPLQPSEK